MDQTVVLDEYYYYIGGSPVALLSSRGCVVTLVSPAPSVSQWTQDTFEQERTQRHLMAKVITLSTQHSPTSILPAHLFLSCPTRGCRSSLMNSRSANVFWNVDPQADEGAGERAPKVGALCDLDQGASRRLIRCRELLPASP
jgi:hypothetical protein